MRVALHKKMIKVGLGGRKCPCCFPSPGSVSRAAIFRAAKRRDKREAMRCEQAAMQDMQG
jgi:hypothetical protein